MFYMDSRDFIFVVPKSLLHLNLIILNNLQDCTVVQIGLTQQRVIGLTRSIFLFLAWISLTASDVQIHLRLPRVLKKKPLFRFRISTQAAKTIFSTLQKPKRHCMGEKFAFDANSFPWNIHQPTFTTHQWIHHKISIKRQVWNFELKSPFTRKRNNGKNGSIYDLKSNLR